MGLLGLLILAAAAPRSATTPDAGRYAIAGITSGMSLAEAVSEMHQTFHEEGLTDVHAVSVNTQLADGGRIRRLTLDQSASTPAVGNQYYREDRFKLRLAGPPGEERVTAITRDYLAPIGLPRAAIVHRLEVKFGQPSTMNLPNTAIAPNSALISWMIGPDGQRLGSGPQSSTELACGNGMLNYFDAFDNAGDNDGDLIFLLHRQLAKGCSLMLQVSLAYDAVHFELYDGEVALNALGGLGAVAMPSLSAQKRKREKAGAVAAGEIRY